MTLQVVYSVSAGVTQDLSSRVFMASERLGLPPVSLTQHAEEGSVAHSTLTVDDPSGTLTLLGHRRVYLVETAAPTGQQVIGNWWIDKKSISRGDWQVGPLARTYSVEMSDANVLLGRRIVVGSDGNRPAETDIARLTWLLATTEANQFNGPTTYINTAGPVAMDAVDYRGQNVIDILSDLSQASQKNWWVVYFEASGNYGLWYDFDYSTAYTSTLSLSNDEADVDDATTFAYFPTATLTQDATRVYSAAYLPFDAADTEAASWVYEQDYTTGNAFTFRDAAYPSVNVKSVTKARLRAQRYLAATDSEEDVVSLSFVVPAASVNALMHGHRVSVKGTHWPTYSTATWMRALNRTVTQLSPAHYRIDAELSPLPPTIEPFAVLYLPQSQPNNSDGHQVPIEMESTGDDPDAGWAPAATIGPIVSNYNGTFNPLSGWTINGTGTIDLEFNSDMKGVPVGTEVGTVRVKNNGATVATIVATWSIGGVWYGQWTLNVVAGDVLTMTLEWAPNAGNRILGLPAGTGQGTYLKITGGALVVP